MSHLLLPTLGMMALTFAIGFFVAGLIKIMAVWADSLNFYGSHHLELIRLKKIRKIHQRATEAVSHRVAKSYYDFYGDKRDRYSRGLTDDSQSMQTEGYYHENSYGVPDMDLFEYYYPKNTKILFLKEQEQWLASQSKQNENSDSESQNRPTLPPLKTMKTSAKVNQKNSKPNSK